MMSDKNLSEQEMREALLAIAEEIKSLENFVANNPREDDVFIKKDVLEKLLLFKSSLNLKNKQTSKLTKDLKTAYITKTIVNTKDNEICTLTKQLNLLRSESTSFFQSNRLMRNVIQQLTLENQSLNNEVQHIKRSIGNVFEELQNTAKCLEHTTSIESQLNTMLNLCKQFCNEHHTRLMYEQKNRFLESKLRILENSLKYMTEEANRLHENRGRSTKNIKNLDQPSNEKLDIEPKLSNEAKWDKSDYIDREQRPTIAVVPILNLQSHLTLVQTLLDEQDAMLNRLKKLST